ncbi:MAG TPA: acetolactate synthase small subunit [Alphaproteobacteria bacterium]|nr:acetolactate synthase small subunit [Alphaproteobacteria bacterium]
MSDGQPIERHTFAVLVANEPGVLARVIGLFSGRGYNIESLTVAEVDRERGRSRITLVTSGTRMVIDQIKAQLERLVPIHRVRDLTEEGPFVGRELALVKVVGESGKRGDVLRIAEGFGARIVDSSESSFVFEVTESTEKVDQFLALMAGLGKLEVARTGIVALSRGAKGIEGE